MKECKILVKTIQYGQPRPYADSYYEYEIESEGFYEQDILDFCTKVLKPCSQKRSEWNTESEGSYFAGYYEFNKISDNKYRYFVVNPYCD